MTEQSKCVDQPFGMIEKENAMKMKQAVITTILTFLLASNASAEGIKTATAPVVGSSIINVAVTEIAASGYRASKLINSDIYNNEGEKIGKIDDFVIGGDSTISFAVLRVGSYLKLDKKLVAVPAVLFETNANGQVVLPKGTKEDLKALPAFKYAW